MNKRYLWTAVILILWSCNPSEISREISNSKLLPVISWIDTGKLHTEDLFDVGRADSVTSRGGLNLTQEDSVQFSFFGGSLPYAYLRAFQGAAYADVLTLRKDSNYRFYPTGLELLGSDFNLNVTEIPTHVWVLHNNHVILDTLLPRGIFNLKPLIPNGKGRSHLRVFGSNDSGVLADLLFPLENGILIEDAAKLDRDDLHGNIMYFAFLDRFFDGNTDNNRKVNHPLVTEKTNYQGGDIKGVETVIKKGYFNDLSINSLWISPITRNPDGAWGNFKDPHVMFSGYHGYWPVLNTVIDPRMGTAAELTSTLKTAHDSGMNVLLDYVAHHVHKEHPIYQKHPDWVTPLYLPDGSLNTERWDDHRLTTWFDTFMPTLDLGRPEIASYMVDSALYWLKEFDFDGFRHDATKHIPENFTRLLTKRIRSQVSQKKRKNVYQIGETYGDPKLISSYVGPGLLDAQFDFNLYDRMVDVFAFGDPFEKLVYEQQRSIETYGLHHVMGNITGNQDRVRFMSFADETLERSKDWNELKRIGHLRDLPAKGSVGFEKFALFYAYQMTAPGIPVIYYGDEYGMTGANDPGNRNFMKFSGLTEHEEQLKSWVKQCAAFRKSSMALLYGDFEMLYVTDDIMVVRRTYARETVITIINKGKEDFRYTPKAGFGVWGGLKQRIANGKAYKDLYRVAGGSALMLQFKK